jgi:phage terminase large subunit-like protein
MLAAGVGGGITGRGAHLLNIDDPFKNRDEASSEAHRKRVLTWYRSVAYTRLEYGGAVVLINTRWDQEDLSGELLRHMVSDELGDEWDVVFLPALALEERFYPKSEAEFRENLLRGIYIPMGGDQIGRQPGEALWREKYDEERLRIIHSNTLDFEFAAQYQQMPRLAEGNFFDDRDFQIVERAPDGLRWFRYVDLAKGQNTGNDFNATYAVAMDAEGNLYIRDPLKERNIDEFLPQCKALMLSDAEIGVTWGIEDVAFQFLVVREFLEDPRLANIPIIGLPVKGSKEDRARAWRLRAKQGKVKLVRGLWNLDFIRIASAFPNGRHDDDVDSISGGVAMIAGEGASQRIASVPVTMVSAEELFV